jgi:[acyl-carrier-protein] S-malonyltransferase
MGESLYHHNTYARQVFDQVEHAIGINVATLCFQSDAETLRATQNAQIALYTVSLAAWTALRASDQSLKPMGFAGHSVGEYAALAAAGALSIEDGARLVAKRGDLMARAGNLRPGTMAAVLGMDRSELEAALKEVPNGTVVVANDNCPGQLVISGDVDAVHAATALLPEKGAKKVIPLNVSGAFHSPLMAESAEAMAEALRQVKFHPAKAPVYSNVTARPGDDFSQLLEEQLRAPVRWAETVQNMIQDGATLFLECGSGEVLTGLLRRIDKSVKGMPVADVATLAETKQALSQLGN